MIGSRQPVKDYYRKINQNNTTMFKKALFILVSCLVCMNIYAQKSSIYVKAFTKSGNNVTASDHDAVKAAVMSALSKCERFEIVTSQDDADFIIEGNVSSCIINKEKTEKGTLYFCALQYSVTAINVATGNTILSESFSHPKNPLVAIKMLRLKESDARSTTFDNIEDDMEDFAIKAFPLTGTIFAEDLEIDGRKLEYCYINIGEKNGVKVGDEFDIFEVKTKVGKEFETKVGRLKVVEVQNDIARCKVTKEKRAVKEAMARYLKSSIDDSNAKLLRIKLID
jgi:hypothetical protein